MGDATLADAQLLIYKIHLAKALLYLYLSLEKFWILLK
ncbi:hypothetical protein BASH2_02468 [Bacillus anthracis]|nr:hypothetical protein BASH2_02468 [Bacillus anthracis]